MKKDRPELIVQQDFEDAYTFLKEITYGGKLYNDFNTGDFSFRGQKSASFELIPAVLRDNCIKIRHANFLEPQKAITEREQFAFEFDVLREFYLKCDECGLYLPENKRLREGLFSFDDCGTITKDGKWLPEDLYDIAALAQHYGLPTRLLDWTYDLNTAIYFAVSELIRDRAYDDLDYISIWAINISYDAWMTLNIAFKDFPLKLIRPIYKYNSNLRAQRGLFTLWETDYKSEAQKTKNRQPLDQLINHYFFSLEPRFHHLFEKPFLVCFKIRQTNRNTNILYNYIKHNHVDASTLFPGYAGVVEFMKHDYIRDVIGHDE